MRTAWVGVACTWALLVSACGGGGGGGETVAAAPTPSGSSAPLAVNPPPAPAPATASGPAAPPPAAAPSPSPAPAPAPAPSPAPSPAPAPATATQLVGLGKGASVAALADGSQVVAWQAPSSVCWQRYTVQSTAAGTAQCMPATRSFNPPAVAALGSGFVLGWTELDSDASNSGSTMKTQAFAADGTPLQGIHSAPSNDVVFGLASASLPSGEVAMTYTTGSEFYLLRIGRDGTVLNAPGLRLDTPSLSIPAGLRVAALAGGGFVVTWDELNDAGGRSVHLRLFDAAFNPRSADLVVPNPQTAFGAVAAALPDGGFVMMWDGVAAGVQRFTANGVALGPRTLLDPAWLQTPPDTCFTPQPGPCGPKQETASLVATSDGGWIALWRNLDGHSASHGAFAMRFGADGSAASAPVLLEGSPVSSRSYPMSITTPTQDAGFVLTWNTAEFDASQPGSSTYRTWFQRYTGASIR